MQYLQTLLENSTVPLLTAFLLGLLTALSPCPLATNITAIGFIGRDIESRHRIFRNGILYTLGRIITYAGIGFILIPILRQGASIFAIQKAIGKYGEMIIAPALILIGLFLLFGGRLNLSRFGFKGSSGNSGGGVNSEKLKSRGGWGALLLGVLFALAFCPTSGVFYFGMLMPMAACESGGMLLPVVFAVATGLPVMVVAWILAYSVAGIGRFYRGVQVLQRWMNYVIGGLFVVVGIYYAI